VQLLAQELLASLGTACLCWPSAVSIALSSVGCLELVVQLPVCLTRPKSDRSATRGPGPVWEGVAAGSVRECLRGASGLGARKGSNSYTPYGLKGLQIRGSRSPGGLEGP
jgi:hypothetical protein